MPEVPWDKHYGAADRPDSDRQVPGLQSIDWKSQSLDCEDEMIEIMWADSWDEYGDDGNPLPLPDGIKHVCHDECDLYDDWNFGCRGGFAIPVVATEAESGRFEVLTPGHDCPGPGDYNLVKMK